MTVRTLTLIPAPTSMQPGGYVAKAYPDRASAATPQVDVDVDTASGFRITLRWQCAHPVIDASDNARQFIDSCALLVPEKTDAPWITMGAPGLPVAGVLWRADKTAPITIRAEGLGSVQRGNPPADWKAESAYADGAWRVTFTLPQWAPLAAQKRFAVAIWQGAQAERAGLKSITTDWQAL